MSLAAVLGAVGLAAVWVAVLVWTHWKEVADDDDEASQMLGAEALYPAERLRVHEPRAR